MARNPLTFYQGTHLTPIVYPTPDGTELSGAFELGSEAHDNWNGTPDDRLSSLGNGPWGSMVFRKPPKAHLIHSCCWPLLARHFANDEMDLAGYSNYAETDQLQEKCHT